MIAGIGNRDLCTIGRHRDVERRIEFAVARTRGFVGLADSFGVLENDDLVVGSLPGPNLGIDLTARHPKPAGGIEIHLNRLGQQRIGGIHHDLPTAAIRGIGHCEGDRPMMGIDEEQEGIVADPFTATLVRPDLLAVFPLFGAAHGFRIDAVVSPGPHTMCVLGLTQGSGPSVGLGCRSI